MENNSSNKRIAKNALFLYVRMFFAVVVNLYAARLLLETLGVDDYGTYNIVGGIITLLLFVNTAMQGATTRFITYSMGRDDDTLAKETVNASIHNHVYILIIVFILAETVGLWFLDSKLNIPESSMVAANWVYQFTILSSCFTIMQIPFSALIISHERMDVYAYIEIFNVLARFLIIYIVPLFFNRLIAYSLLLTLCTGLVFGWYVFYSCRYIDIFCFRKSVDRAVSQPILKFALWSLFGNGTYALSRQGTNILINKFFGVAANAAGGIATQASSVISTFVSSVQSAFSPQVIKSYSAGNVQRMQDLLKKETIIMISLAALMFTPLFINMEYILSLWLKTVPYYTSIFCKVLLCCNLIQVPTNVLAVAIQATGHNKLFSFIIGTINIICVILVVICFNSGMDAYYAYISLFSTFVIKLIIESILLKYYERKVNILSITWNTITAFSVLLISFLITYFLIRGANDSLLKVICSVLLNAIVLLGSSYLLIKDIRPLEQNYVNKIIKKITNL